MNRVAITGWALRTAMGDEVEAVLDRLLAGGDGLAPTSPARAPMSGLPRPSRHRRFLKRMALFALEVGHEAWAATPREVPPERLGLFFGYGGLRAHWEDLVPAFAGQHPDGDGRAQWARGLRTLHPFWMLGHLSNNAHALLGIDLGARGDGLTLAGANAGAQSLGAACDALRAGAVDAAIVVGYDTLLEPETLFALDAQGLSTRDAPEGFRAAYDANARGLCPGEGAAAVVLERSDTAGERALAFVDAVDAADGDNGWPQPSTIDAALARLVGSAGTPSLVVDGAARGQPTHDDTERTILARYFPHDTPLLSLSSAFGHLGGAASIVQCVVLAGLLRRGRLPASGHLMTPSPGPLSLRAAPTSTRAKVAVGLTAHPPGLVGAVRVEVP